MMRTMRTFVLVVLAGALAAACGSSTAKSALPRAVSPSTTVAHTTTAARTTTTTSSTTTSSTTTPTTSAPTTARPNPVPVLGHAWGSDQQGYGTAGPATIDNGGDPTGLVSDVHWSGWGDAQAIATGVSTYVGPNQIVADGTQQPATVVAWNLGTCHGAPSYNAVEWFFPQHGAKFDPNNYINACTGQYVGSP